MPKSTTNLGVFSVPIQEQKQTEDGRGRISLNVGTRSARVDAIIDFDKLAKSYARKALRTNSGRSVLANGAIVFQVDKSTIVLDQHEPRPLQYGDR